MSPASDDEGAPPSLALDGPRALLRLERPRQRNRIEPDDVAIVHAHLDAIEGDRRVRALVVTGSGTTFSSGYDLRALDAEVRGGADDVQSGRFERLMDRIEDFPVPTICALNGGAYGGATDLALACDVRIGVPAMEARMPAAQLGLQFYPGGLRRFVERLGLDHAKRLFLWAEPVAAAELLRIGFLHEIVPADALPARADALAAAVAANAASSVRGLKRTLNAIARGGHDAAETAAAFAASLRSGETAERLRAFRSRNAAP